MRKWIAAWVLILIAPLFVLFSDYAIQYLFYLTANSGTFSDLGAPSEILLTLLPNQFVIIAVNALGFSGTAPFIVLGALAAGGDWGRGTIKTSLSQGPGRLKTFFGQALAVGLALAASVALTFAVAAAASLFISVLEADAASPADAALPEAVMVLRGLAVALAVSWLYGAAGLALGTLLRGAGAAIAVALVWTVAVEGLLDTLALQAGGLLQTINDALPAASAVTLLDTFGSPGGGSDTAMYLRVDPTVATVVVAGYTSVFLVLGALVMWRRDVS